MTTETRRRRLLVKVLLGLVSAIVTIAVLEGGARLLRLRTGFFLGVSREACTQRSALLSQEFQPNCTTVLRGTPLRTNALGLRGEDVRDDGPLRILTIGDSCTYGWRVAQSESYPAVLQRLLDDAYGSRRYQVINAGVPGYTSYQGLVYLRERGMRLKPSIVIASFGFNDGVLAGDVEAQIVQQRHLMPLLHVDDFLLAQSRFYRWMRTSADARRRKGLPPRVAVERHRANLTSIVEVARAGGAAVVLLSFWDPADFRNDYRDTLIDVAREQSVPLVVFEGPNYDFVHPTAEGYEILAGAILGELRRAGYVPGT